MVEEASSSVRARPPIKREIRDETSEVLGVYEASRLTREEKLKIESEISAKGAEVDFFERSWKKTTFHSLPEIEGEIDRIAARSITGAPPEAAFARHERHAEGAQRVASRAYDRPIAKHYPLRVLNPHELGHISAHLDAQVLRTEVKYRTSQGEVVEVWYEEKGEELKTLVILAGNKVRTVEEIANELDSKQIEEEKLARLPRRDVERGAPSVAPEAREAPDWRTPPYEPPAPDTATTEETGSRAITVGEAPPRHAPVAEEPAPKKKFGMPKVGISLGKKKREDSLEPTGSEGVSPAPETKKGIGVPKVKLPFGRKKNQVGATESGGSEASPPASEAPVESSEKKVLGGFLKRKKK